jgi:hypothetical protein
MLGPRKENGSGGNAKKDDGRKTVYRKKERKTSFEMDNLSIVVTDLRAMKIKKWTEKAKDREQWRMVVKEAKAHPGL